MTGTSPAPADTRMMGIIHDALRRDLLRALEVLPAPRLDAGRRAAIGEQIIWMMDFLHAHHRGEDAWLWPLLRKRAPQAGPLLDEMEADHALVDPLIDACSDAAARYRNAANDAERPALVDALGRLRDALLPHLRREEDQVMPLASVFITDAEWRAIDQEHFVKPKSMTQLAREGHWLLDGLDAERREVLLRQVPAIPRFVLLHGFAHHYRRRARACWGEQLAAAGAGRKAYGPAPAPPRSVPAASRVAVTVDAPIDAVWTIVSDPTRTSEWSHECRRLEWLGGANAPAVGVRFRGTNRSGRWAWTRTNEIVAADPPHTLVWRTIPTLRYRDSSEWSITLEAVDGGTRITQTYRALSTSPVIARTYAFLVPSHRGRVTELTEDLRRLGALAAAQARA